MDLQALRHCPEFEPRSNKGPVGLKIHSLSLGKIHLECKIVHNCATGGAQHPAVIHGFNPGEEMPDESKFKYLMQLGMQVKRLI